MGVVVYVACGSSPQTKGGGTLPGCTPTTCAAQARNCGLVPDGCGGTLDCGSCPSSQSCGGGGTANVCGAHTPAGGQTRWVRLVDGPGDDMARAVGADDQGSVVTLVDDTEVGATVLEKDDATGQRLWSKPLDADGLVVSGGGDLFLAIRGSAPAAPVFAPPSVARYGPDGSFLSTVDTCNGGPGECTISVLSADPAGDVLVESSFFAITPMIRVFSATGQVQWVQGVEDSFGTFGPVALDRQGHVIVGLATSADGSFRGQPVQANRHYVIETDLAGNVRWIRELPGLSGTMTAFGASAGGTVVVAGTFSDTFTWGNDTIQSAGRTGFLLTIESDGRPRWARKLDHPEADSWQLAVDPVGRAALGGMGLGCSPSVVLYYDLAGEALWSSDLPSACGAQPGALVAALADHEVVVGGMLGGSTDLEQGMVSATGRAAFVVDLAP